jgi:hypothetical protein
MTEPDLALPAGSRLVHIGFPKTGTTSIQGAMHNARPALGRHDVVYPGTRRYHKHAGIAITQVKGRRGDAPAKESDWLDVVKEANAAGDGKQVMISSEWLSEANDEGVRRVVNDLGAGRVHVVATLRPLVKIMPSAWQQYLQNGHRLHYDRWLTGMLLEPPYDSPTPSFWARHSHDAILARWAEAAGAENVTAIVVDSRDHDLLLRQFSSLLGLPAGTLVQPELRDNRSLTWPEAELLRTVNGTIQSENWPDALFKAVVRLGIVEKLFTSVDRAVVAEMPKIGMPSWAADRATEIGARFAENIAKLGIRVVGDLESLGRPPSASDVVDHTTAMLPAPVAAEAVLAAVRAGRKFGRGEGRGSPRRAGERSRQAAKAAAAQPSTGTARRAAGKARRTARKLLSR